MDNSNQTFEVRELWRRVCCKRKNPEARRAGSLARVIVGMEWWWRDIATNKLGWEDKTSGVSDTTDKS